MNPVLVTGANGFVGRAMCRVLLARGHAVTGLVRKAGHCVEGVVEWQFDGADFEGLGEQRWPEIDCVIHLAARVHVMKDTVADPDHAFRATNLDGTLRVAEAARRHGARRFIFVSSVKAVAECDDGTPLSEEAPATPLDPYGRSKRDAELALMRYGEQSGLEIVIVRPPLVYGPGVRANFLRMLDTVARGVPLPFASISARRSIVYVDNLADALCVCVDAPEAVGEIFHVADDDAPSVAGLLNMVAEALGVSARLLPFSPGVLNLIGRLAGRGAQMDRLTRSLQLDTDRIRRRLGWLPPFTTRQGLAATADWYRSRDRGT